MTDAQDNGLRKRNIRTLVVLALIAVAFYGGFIALTALKG